MSDVLEKVGDHVWMCFLFMDWNNYTPNYIKGKNATSFHLFTTLTVHRPEVSIL